MELPQGKKVYFASDFHLGIPDRTTSLEREKRICAWLDGIKADAGLLYLVGDLFDTWFEYKNVIPKGYIRFLGKLAELSDGGLQIEAFTGNHDLWMLGYFEKELNIPVHHHPIEREINGKKFFIGHGDGLGPGDHGYKFIKKIFRNKACQWLFGILPPYIGMGIAGYFSRKSRAQTGQTDEVFLGEDKEWLVVYSKEMLQTAHYDYFVFGHRHLPLDIKLNDKSRYINLGDWIKYDSYAVFDGTDLVLKYHKIPD